MLGHSFVRIFPYISGYDVCAPQCVKSVGLQRHFLEICLSKFGTDSEDANDLKRVILAIALFVVKYCLSTASTFIKNSPVSNYWLL